MRLFGRVLPLQPEIRGEATPWFCGLLRHIAPLRQPILSRGAGQCTIERRRMAFGALREFLVEYDAKRKEEVQGQILFEHTNALPSCFSYMNLFGSGIIKCFPEDLDKET